MSTFSRGCMVMLILSAQDWLPTKFLMFNKIKAKKTSKWIG